MSLKTQLSRKSQTRFFPNNWLSTHHDGRIALFPMYSALRRRERRQDIVEELRKHYRVTR